MEIHTNFITLQTGAQLGQVPMFYGKPVFVVFRKINTKITLIRFGNINILV